jgi:cysteine desulfurase/selenocysteine lyase
VGTLDAERIRADFPIFREVPGLAYLDSAATSQRPQQVIDAVAGFYTRYNSNVARGLYRIAEEATLAYEGVRGAVRGFINAQSEKEVIFTRNATESANVVMRGWGEKFIRRGDRIVTTLMEHHSNFVPWQQLARMSGAEFEVIGFGDDGLLDMADAEKKLKGAKLFAFSAASNVLGTLNDARALSALASEQGAISVVDGAQSVPSMPTDVRRMGCDFLMFSGHKMLAPFCSGVLYGRAELLEGMDPFLYGSAMISGVGVQKSGWASVPQRFEAGTPAVDAVIGLGAAIRYLDSVGMENVRRHEERLVSLMLDSLGEIPGVKILGPADAGKRGGLAAFTLDGVHPHDVSAMLAESNVCVRSGHHCAMPLHGRLGIPASTRASVYIYNTPGEIARLAESVVGIKKAFG